MHGFSLPGSESSMSLFLVSYLLLGELIFDRNTKLPTPPKSHFIQTFSKFVVAILVLSLFLSLLNFYDFQLCDTGIPINSIDHLILDFLSLPHIFEQLFSCRYVLKTYACLHIPNYSNSKVSVLYIKFYASPNLIHVMTALLQ